MLATIILNCLIITSAVLVHYELLNRTSNLLVKYVSTSRFAIVIILLMSLCAHAIEVWLFAAGYYFMMQHGGFGNLTGAFDGSLLDCAYFSFTTYTSLGFGDIAPIGNLRFLAGLEALTGLVLITWTASFIFIEMQKHWNR
ncbi:potassium channel family protein [Pleionea sp. CnH1-48]|uniref:potassium channel family protein n=1 Tax=Pleionea sp. CnH1-48 TaxID=2954494 RepID=UPI002096FEFF|nr:potassium channel family protein [Pleionea sp. CnH1-48]MCO7225896.1 potassium channel family protein [Pleionea sp. CnH1-48]